MIAELLEPGEQVLLAKGGDGGFGNLHFKSSTNRAPRQKTPGWPGEQKQAQARAARARRCRPARHAERRQVDADRGDLERAAEDRRLSVHDAASQPRRRARRRPSRASSSPTFPGLIEGAAEGAGLGHQFLRHLQRTRLLLHLVDFAPFDDGVDPVAQARAIVAELKKYDPALHAKPRWLVLNKIDMVPAEERDERVKDFVRRLRWKGPVFPISALTREGCEPLVRAVYEHVAAEQRVPPTSRDPRFDRADDAETRR